MSRSFSCFSFRVCGAFLALLLAAPVRPQSSNGSLRGAVQDQTKAAIPAVTVLITDQATGVSSRTKSNDSGLYVFPALVPGLYTITAEHPGMAKFEVTATVQSQASASIDIILRPAGTQAAVTVQDRHSHRHCGPAGSGAHPRAPAH